MNNQEFESPLEDFARKLRNNQEEIPQEIKESYENNKDDLYA